MREGRTTSDPSWIESSTSDPAAIPVSSAKALGILSPRLFPHFWILVCILLQWDIHRVYCGGQGISSQRLETCPALTWHGGEPEPTGAHIVEVSEDGKLATITATTFEGLDEADRQERVWGYLREHLADDDLLYAVEFVFTYSPKEQVEGA